MSEPGLRRRGHGTRWLPPPCPFFLFCFLYASVVVNHQRRGLLLCLSTYPGCSVQIVLWGPAGWLPGEPGPYLRLVHTLGNGPVTCSFSLFFRSVISLGSRPILSLSLSLSLPPSLSLSLSQPISILKANQSECLSSLCVLWRFLPFYVAVLFVRDVTSCCALFLLFNF